jgi:hypothetical protein
MRRSGHLAPIRFTREEWRTVATIAACRRMTIEDMVRETLGMPPFDEASEAIPDPEPRRASYIRLVTTSNGDGASTRAS